MSRRIITLEEHFLDPGVAMAGADRYAELSPASGEAYRAGAGLPYSPTFDTLADLGDSRIADMTAGGVSMQVLSALSTQVVPASVAAPVVRASNDRAAAATRAHPDRFAAFAALPTTVPDAAPDELTRCVEELGFVGAMVMGRTGEDFLSAGRFAPLLARIASLDVPLYLHPGVPPRRTSEENYEGGLDPLVAARFQTSAWGWHNETAVHFIHLVLSGVFDRHPELTVILGHWGELMPYFLERIDESLPRRVTGLDREFSDYVRQNTYVTPSGMWNQAQLRFCIDVLGVDRIMYSVDYPFIDNERASTFLEEAAITEAQKDLIAHGTAERLLRL